MTHPRAGVRSGPGQPPVGRGSLCCVFPSLLSLPLFYLHSSHGLCPLLDYCDPREGGRWPGVAAGGPHSVALQTLTKYASEAFCLCVVVPSGVVRDPEALSCVWPGGLEDENSRAHRPWVEPFAKAQGNVKT